MSLLLDTHALLWWLADDAKLGAEARNAIAESEVLVSSASVWEIAIKRKFGKLMAPDDLLAQLERQRFVQLPLSAADAWVAGHWRLGSVESLSPRNRPAGALRLLELKAADKGGSATIRSLADNGGARCGFHLATRMT